jgi:hypothetical protein
MRAGIEIKTPPNAMLFFFSPFKKKRVCWMNDLTRS